MIRAKVEERGTPRFQPSGFLLPDAFGPLTAQHLWNQHFTMFRDGWRLVQARMNSQMIFEGEIISKIEVGKQAQWAWHFNLHQKLLKYIIVG